MPELPEVEVLVRHLAPLLKNQSIRGVEIHRRKVIAPTSEREFAKELTGAKFAGLSRRGKYLLFALEKRSSSKQFPLLGHLGMTGRIFLQPKDRPLPKHAAVTMDLGKYRFVYEDTRYFGRLTLDASAVEKLGPEPLEKEFSAEYFTASLARSSQAIKVKLLDQTLVAGVGNIYASEALFRAGVSPKTPANKLNHEQVKRLRRTIREVLARAIRFGSTVPLDFAGENGRDGLFYYGQGEEGRNFYEERLSVYDREGKPCVKCRKPVRRITQAARSTYYCGHCQRG